CNLRSSRSMPYVSKTRGINLMRLAAEVILEKPIPEELLDYPMGNFVCTKVPQFSFMRLDKADPRLGVEMASTGEAACVGDTFPRALIRSLRAVDMEIPIEKGTCLITVAGDELKQEMVPIAEKFVKLGFNIYATEGTANVLKENGISNIKVVGKIRHTKIKPNIIDVITSGEVDIVINIPRPTIQEEKFEKIMEDEYTLRRKSVEFNIPCITNRQLAAALVDAIEDYRITPSRVLSLNEYHEKCLKKTYW
ncbi:MAG: carbamoyl phosphate synthase large subunit, partial [archaeon]|nr:carbamoyl phosphate synthase large subunit [archaeon]